MKHHPLIHARGAIRSYIAAQESRGHDVKRLRRIYASLCVYIGMYVPSQSHTSNHTPTFTR